MAMNIRNRWRAWRNSASRESDLDAAERRAEASASRFKTLEYISAAVVVFGVVIDDTTWLPSIFGFVAFWSSVKDRGVGGAMIALGIILETLCSMLVSSREKRIASVNARRRAEAEQKTAEALREAAKATLRAEEESLRRANIEASLRHLHNRELSEPEIDTLRKAIRPFSGQMFWIITQTNDYREHSEPMFFSQQIEGILISEGWVKGGYTGQTYRRISASGVEVASGAGAEAQMAAARLAKALSELHINMRPQAVYTNIALTLVLIDIGLS
jgi:hypothetical protein